MALIVRAETVVFGDRPRQAADIVVEQGRFVAIEPYGSVHITSSDQRLEIPSHLWVLPGLVDSHVHVNEPGRTEWEGFYSATRSAAWGGVTTIVDMPLNSSPVTTSLSAFQEKLESTQAKLWIDCGFYGGVIPENTHALAPMIKAGVRGFKMLLIDSGIAEFPAVSEKDLLDAMPVLAHYNTPLLVHAELDCRCSATSDNEHKHPQRYQTYLDSRPPYWELDAIEQMIHLCRLTRCPVHIVHLSCAEALPMIAQAQQEGLPLPWKLAHITLFLRPKPLKTVPLPSNAPPIREQDNAKKLWQGLQSGLIQAVVSDHSPCTPALKCLESGDFMQAWGGIASLQLGLSLMYRVGVIEQGVSLEQVVQWMAQATSQLVGLDHQKGQIQPGFDADFVLFDPNYRYTLTANMIMHRHAISPYLGQMMQGQVKATYLRGQAVYQQGVYSELSQGQVSLKPVKYQAV